MFVLFLKHFNKKKSFFCIDWKTDDTKEGHMDNLHSFSFLLFCFQGQHILVFVFGSL